MREVPEEREGWLDLQALRAREADLDEMGREACPDLLVPKVSRDCRDCLDWRELRGTGVTRETRARKEMKDPEE